MPLPIAWGCGDSEKRQGSGVGRRNGRRQDHVPRSPAERSGLESGIAQNGDKHALLGRGHRVKAMAAVMQLALERSACATCETGGRERRERGQKPIASRGLDSGLRSGLCRPCGRNGIQHGQIRQLERDEQNHPYRFGDPRHARAAPYLSSIRSPSCGRGRASYHAPAAGARRPVRTAAACDTALPPRMDLSTERRGAILRLGHRRLWPGHRRGAQWGQRHAYSW